MPHQNRLASIHVFPNPSSLPNTSAHWERSRSHDRSSSPPVADRSILATSRSSALRGVCPKLHGPTASHLDTVTLLPTVCRPVPEFTRLVYCRSERPRRALALRRSLSDDECHFLQRTLLPRLPGLARLRSI